MNNNPYFGFTQPGNQNPFMTPNAQYPGAMPGVAYQGAMPATLGGVGASPDATVMSGSTPNMQAMLPYLQGGMQMMGAGQRSAQPVSMGSALGRAAPSMMMGLMQNPQMQQQMQQGMQGMQGLFGGLGSGVGG